MVHQVSRFSDAFMAWESWNLTSHDFKSKCLLSFKSRLLSYSPLLVDVVEYQLNCAEPFIAQVHQLTGATGETNELYTAGRGVALLVQRTHGTQAELAMMAQLIAALIAGNSVIICSDDNEFTGVLNTVIAESTLPAHLIQITSFDAYDTLLVSDIRNLGYVGDQHHERIINRRLAQRPGAIVNLVAETNFEVLPLAHDPRLVLRYVTERTRTINITAVGGNASLLELGSEAH
jgi:delta 1-pyrroline-5-carboxylate dehydrogenase